MRVRSSYRPPRSEPRSHGRPPTRVALLGAVPTALLAALALLVLTIGSGPVRAQSLAVSVPSTGQTVTLTGLVPGASYQLRMSGWMTFGRWQANGRTLQNDACFEFNAKGYPDPLPVLNSDAGAILCGAYAPDHVYFSGTFTAASSSMRFWVFDSDYRDNSGSLLVEAIPVAGAQGPGGYCVLRNQDLYGPPVCYQFYLADTTRSSGAMATLTGGTCQVTPLAQRQGWEVDPSLGGPYVNWEAADQAMSTLSRYGGDFYGCLEADGGSWWDDDEGAGDDSCRWAFDGECDEPGIGTGVCDAGTDTTDCQGLRGNVGPNTCRWAFDGECDEPGIGTGLCEAGTDTADCGISADPANSCRWAFDGECDEPGIGTGFCDAGTDTADCGGAPPPIAQEEDYVPVPEDAEERDQQLSQCDAWSATNSGGAEGTVDRWDISTIPDGATFDLRFEAYSQPDIFRVSYQGATRWDSGWRGSGGYESNPRYAAGVTVPGDGEQRDLFVKSGTTVFEVVVIGGESGTSWEYRVRCRMP